MLQLNTWLYQGSRKDVDKGNLDRDLRKIVRVSLPNVQERPFVVEGAWSYDYLWCPFDDDGKLLTREKLHTIESFVMNNIVPTLVHCSAGVNRSVVTVAYLLTCHDGLSPEDAARSVKERHGNVKVFPTLIEKMKQLTGKNFDALL